MTVSYAVYWLFVIAGFISACIGLYLMFVVSSEIPTRYPLAFYVLGVVLFMIRGDLLLDGETAIVLLRALGIIVLIIGELLFAYHVVKEYEVGGPIREYKKCNGDSH